LNKKKKIEILESKLKLYDDWQDGFKTAQEIAPQIQRNKELTEWQKNALKDLPEEASDIPVIGLEDQLNRDFTHLKLNLPIIPSNDVASFAYTTGSSSAITSEIFSIVSRAGDIDTPETKSYSKKYAQSYQELQESQSRSNEVRKLISELGNNQTVRRFDDAKEAVTLYKTGTYKRTGCATDIRNLLAGVEGDLFQNARKWDKENMTWETMAERLSKEECEFDEIIRQKGVRSSLLDRLADVLKDREGGSITNIEFIWTQVLDHLIALLVLCKKPNSH